MTTQFSPPPAPGTASPNGRHPSAAEYPTSGYVPGGFVPDQSGALPPAPPPVERLPRMRRPRRPALAAGGVALVALCGVTSAALATAGDRQVQVLTLAHDVQYGQTLTAEDLRVARISGSGVQALSAAGLSNVVGQRVTASLPAGTLLNDSMLSSAPLPAGGLQLVAVAVKPGGVPEQAAPGRVVSLLRIPSPTAGDSKGAMATVLVAQARLASITRDDATGLQILSVEVPQAAALAVAQASAAGAIAITLLPVAG